MIADPSGSWEHSTAQQYIDSQIATVNTNLTSETIARQNGDANLRTQLQSEQSTRADQDGNLLSLIQAGLRDGDALVFDTVPTQNSANPVTSGGIYSTLKDSNIGFVDDVPTTGSNNLVKSGGVGFSVNNKVDITHGVNLINPKTISKIAYINNLGEILPASGTNFCVTDFIPVNGNNIISNAYNNSSVNAIRPYAVYDSNFNFIRVLNPGQTQYTYQNGDAFVRITIQKTQSTTFEEYCKANYGSLLINEPFIQNKQLFDVAETKLDKIIGTNIINPSKFTSKSYINNQGIIESASSDTFVVSEYIPVNGQNIVSNAYYTSETNLIRSYAVYDENYQVIRVAEHLLNTYTYQQGDVYVRFGFSIAGDIARASYGSNLSTEEYTDYLPVADLEERKLDKEIGKNLVDPNKIIYPCYINSNGNISRSEGFNNYGVSDLIPVNSQNIVSNAYDLNESNNIRSYVVYDEGLQVIRVADPLINTYTYQQGDAYIRLGFKKPNTSTFAEYAKANYGSSDLTVEEYTDYYPLTQLKNEIAETKLDKIIGTNIINPSKFIIRKFINNEGKIRTADSDSFVVSEYISVNGQNIVSNAYYTSVTNIIRSYAVYDENYQIIRVAEHLVNTYTYQPGDVYVRFGFSIANDIARASYGSNLSTEKYTDYYPLLQLEDRVEDIEEAGSGLVQQDDIIYIPNYLYKVWNDIDLNRQYILKLGLSRMMGLNEKYNKNIVFENGLRFIPILPSSVSQKTQNTLSIITGKTTTVRNIPASLSVNTKPRVLIIGDSVTGGYYSDRNKEPSELPNQYWAYAKMYFEMDKIDNSDSGHEILFLGGSSGTAGTNASFTINYKSVTRVIHAKVEARGGAALNELFTAKWGNDGGSDNPFYDSVNQTFSISAYITNYRTMDNLGVRLSSVSSDPHGETVIGSDGLTYTIGQKITSQSLLSNIDVCTPTHIFVNLNHNTSVANFESNISNVINIIKTDVPSVKVAWIVIDSTGTNFPRDYQDYDPSILSMHTLHTKNNGFFNYFRDNLENESNGIYLLGMNFIQPEAIDFAHKKINFENNNIQPYYISDAETLVIGQYHPNNICHSIWGYELYSFIKWVIS